MHFDNWRSAWVMAGHGPFVWSTVAITGFVLLILLLLPVLRKRQLWRREQRRQHYLQVGAQSDGTAI